MVRAVCFLGALLIVPTLQGCVTQVKDVEREPTRSVITQESAETARDEANRLEDVIADIEQQSQVLAAERDSLLKRADELRQKAYELARDPGLTKATRRVESNHYENFAKADGVRANRYDRRIQSLRTATAALRIRHQTLLREAAKFRRRHAASSP